MEQGSCSCPETTLTQCKRMHFRRAVNIRLPAQSNMPLLCSPPLGFVSEPHTHSSRLKQESPPPQPRGQLQRCVSMTTGGGPLSIKSHWCVILHNSSHFGFYTRLLTVLETHTYNPTADIFLSITTLTSFTGIFVFRNLPKNCCIYGNQGKSRDCRNKLKPKDH